MSAARLSLTIEYRLPWQSRAVLELARACRRVGVAVPARLERWLRAQGVYLRVRGFTGWAWLSISDDP